MKRFLVENLRKGTTIYVTVHNPPYENEHVLYKTGYKEKDVKITELSNSNTIDLSDYKSIDNEHDERENSLMGVKPKKVKKVKGKK
tara:strand:+ start:1075 stop:1332 length:258 start_codon:yes stop_codon:yes gene_type:complete